MDGGRDGVDGYVARCGMGGKVVGRDGGDGVDGGVMMAGWWHDSMRTVVGCRGVCARIAFDGSHSAARA